MGWRKYAAGAAGFTLGGIVANVPGAFAGGYYAYKKAEADENSSPKRMKRGYPSPPRTPVSRKKAKLTIKYSRTKSARRPNYKKSYKRPKRVRVARKSAFTGMSTVVGMGRFPKSSTKNYEALCLKYGYSTTNEVYGRVEDPDCVFISHNTYHVLSIVRAITGALLRKLFKKSGIDIVNNKAGINFAQQTTGAKIDGRLQYQTYNPLTGLYSNQVMDLTDFMNFDDILTTWADNTVSNRLGSYLYGYLLSVSDDELRTVTLLTKDNSAVVNDFRPLAHLIVPNEYISIYVTSEMKIQNRTKAQQAEGADYSLDRVDNQPLVGRMYKFRHADPRLKELSFRNDGGQALDVVFNRQNLAGVTLTRAAEVIYATFQEPPVKAHFANCSSAQKINLLPGDMKTSKISHVYKGMFINLLKKMRAERYSTGTTGFDQFLSGIPGKNQMFALEEELRTDSTNKITINYECEFKVGAIVKTRKKATAFTSLLTAETHSNTT